jgi:hypothetical protein
MNSLNFSPYAIGICMAETMLAACGSQSPIGAPDAMSVSTGYPQKSFTRNVGRATSQKAP